MAGVVRNQNTHCHTGTSLKADTAGRPHCMDGVTASKSDYQSLIFSSWGVAVRGCSEGGPPQVATVMSILGKVRSSECNECDSRFGKVLSRN